MGAHPSSGLAACGVGVPVACGVVAHLLSSHIAPPRRRDCGGSVPSATLHGLAGCGRYRRSEGGAHAPSRPFRAHPGASQAQGNDRQDVLAAQAGDARITAQRPRGAWLGCLGGPLFALQAELVVSRIRTVFAHAPVAVALTSLEVVCNGIPTSRRFGSGVGACSFGCRAVGGDGARHHFACLVIIGTLVSHHKWRRPAGTPGGVVRSLLYRLPFDGGVALYRVFGRCRV